MGFNCVISVLQSVAECCRVLQSVAVCCSVLQLYHSWDSITFSMLQCVALLQYVAIGIYKQITNTYESHQNGGGGEGGLTILKRTPVLISGFVVHAARTEAKCVSFWSQIRARACLRGVTSVKTLPNRTSPACVGQRHHNSYMCVYTYINIYI